VTSLAGRIQQLQFGAFHLLHNYNARQLDACGHDSVVAARILRHAPGGWIEVGSYNHIRGRLITWLPDSRIVTGDNVILQAYAIVEAYASVTIGDDTMIGAWTIISDGRGHSLDWADRVEDQKTYRKPGVIKLDHMNRDPIVIGKGCWLGTRVIVMPGVSIGDGVTIGAASVVTRDIPEFTIAAGNPAKVIRELEHRRPPGG
jgi:galactoside O-acetyltransferase